MQRIMCICLLVHTLCCMHILHVCLFCANPWLLSTVYVLFELQRAANKSTETAPMDAEDEEIPQLVPIESPSKKPKIEVSITYDAFTDLFSSSS